MSARASFPYARWQRGSQSPPWPYTINRDSPQAEGLVLWMPMAMPGTKTADGQGLVYDLAHGFTYAGGLGNAAGSMFGSSQFTCGSDGRWGVEFSAANKTTNVDLGTIIPITQNCTVVLHQHKLDATSRLSIAFGQADNHDGGAIHLFARIPWVDGGVYWNWGGDTDGVTRVGASGLTIGDDIWVFTVGARGMEIWQNGVLVASNGANPTRTIGSGSVFLGYWSYQGTDFGCDLVRIKEFRIYNVQLPQAVCYQCYDPATRYDLYSPLGSGLRYGLLGLSVAGGSLLSNEDSVGASALIRSV